MKNFLLIAGVVFLVVLFLVFRDSGNEITNIHSTGSTIVAFGDSLVEGVGATEGNDFVSVLSKRIGEPIINEGISGNTTVDGLNRIHEVLEYEPKVVILLLGGNDAIKKVPVEETFANLKDMIETIHENGSAVILVGVQSGVLRDRYKKEYKNLSEEMGAAYVPDILDGLFGNASFMSDPIHPNDAGYALIADKIEPVLRSIITK